MNIQIESFQISNKLNAKIENVKWQLQAAGGPGGVGGALMKLPRERALLNEGGWSTRPE